MDARKERGLQLAQRGQIVKLTQRLAGAVSQSGNGSYFVRLAKQPSCTCPDFEIWQQPCKHIYAVEYLIIGRPRRMVHRLLPRKPRQSKSPTNKTGLPIMRHRRKRKSVLLCS